MSIKLVVAVTDRDWFDHLRRMASLQEVNFWAPSAVNFKALTAGELFLFKLHAPMNFIVGGGVFRHATNLPCSFAWKAFGEANGASTFAEMRSRIARYRRVGAEDRSDFVIGCRVLTQPFFFDERDWIPSPASWSRNIVSFKTYSTDDGDGGLLWHSVQERLEMAKGPTPVTLDVDRFGAPTLVTPRLGQGSFRILVTDLYRRRCAVTEERTLPALEAAHIRPYSDGGEHSPQNGLLLRSDIHSLFDAGYVTITPDLRFEVSRRIREEFENGRHYYALQGAPVSVPDQAALHPAPDALRWHNEHRFQA